MEIGKDEERQLKTKRRKETEELKEERKKEKKDRGGKGKRKGVIRTAGPSPI
ncbi:hypothetical protein K457DRAFT_142803, partial [Linnemannia elongata AG-77]